MDKATVIVNGLNQFSRESEKLDEKCDLNAILDNCLTMLGSIMNKNIDIKKHYYNEKIIMKGNVGQLHQVFVNILVNAVQAIEQKGKIVLKTELHKNSIRIVIEDNGIGISKENLSKIADPFFTTKDPGKGTGLGLSISYSIIKEHNGNIEFKSQLGKGTSVQVTFPL